MNCKQQSFFSISMLNNGNKNCNIDIKINANMATTRFVSYTSYFVTF